MVTLDTAAPSLPSPHTGPPPGGRAGGCGETLLASPGPMAWEWPRRTLPAEIDEEGCRT